MKTRQLLMGAALIILSAVLVLFVLRRATPVPGEAAPQETSATAAEATPLPTPLPTPSPTAPPTPTPSPEPTPEPTPDKLAGFEASDWRYKLVNVNSTISGDFVPEVTELESGQYFDSRAVDALQAFIDAARAEGYTVILRSSYRSYATQETLFNNKIAQQQNWYGYDYETAKAAAAKIVAIPGTSEHQLGLSCDIVDGWYEYMNESLENTALLQWMTAHCAEYGFILRYPKDKTDITMIMYEPWHFRYVGEEAASYIVSNGLCLEEFCALIA